MINLQKQPSQPPSPNSSSLFQKWWRKCHTVLWILTAFLSLFTCVRFNIKKYNPDPKVSAETAKPSEPYLKVSENLIEREGYDCKVRKVYIETDSYWYIDTLSDWIRASKYPDMIMLSFEQNTTDGPRFGKIIIRSANRSHTITVIQHAVPLTIRPSKNRNNHYANSDENEETEYEYGDPDSPDYEGQRDKFGNYPEKDGKYPSKYGHHPDKYGPLDKYPYPNNNICRFKSEVQNRLSCSSSILGGKVPRPGAETPGRWTLSQAKTERLRLSLSQKGVPT